MQSSRDPGTGNPGSDWICSNCLQRNCFRRQNCYKYQKDKDPCIKVGKKRPSSEVFDLNSNSKAKHQRSENYDKVAEKRHNCDDLVSNSIKCTKNQEPSIINKSSSKILEKCEILLKLIGRPNISHSQIEDKIASASSFWLKCWEIINQLSTQHLEVMLGALNKVSISVIQDAYPPIEQIQTAVKNYLLGSKGSNEILSKVEMVHNMVKKLLAIQWKEEKEIVKKELKIILSSTISVLSADLRDHFEIIKSILETMDSLDKPWAIKETLKSVQSSTNLVEIAAESSSWQNVNISWLANVKYFQPALLPVMNVPSDKSSGVYNSAEEYFEIVMQLWIGLTFIDGNSNLNPKCCYKFQEKKCGQVLLPSSEEKYELHCLNSCSFPVVLQCTNSRHTKGLCSKCAQNAKAELMGPAGPRASTNIYDCQVTKVDYEGRIYMNAVESRKPPNQIYWRSTQRLSSANLVGLVKLSAQGASLNYDDIIIWGEIVSHGDPRDEFKRREQKCLCVSISTISDSKLMDNIKKDDYLAVIDCITFAPEHIPVLKALDIQKVSTLPFQKGALLNIGNNKDITNFEICSQKLNSLIDEKIPLPSYKTNLEMIIDLIIDQSQVHPIVCIRGDEKKASKLREQLTHLISSTTLDNKQLQSFAEALIEPVHLTQGPPGTGKSYLGVAVVQALIIIQKLCYSDLTFGVPPILVLSYKNHAIDKFLTDLIKAERNVDLIRIGNSNEPNLYRYSEKSIRSSDYKFKQTTDNLQLLLKQKEDYRKMQNELSPIFIYEAFVQSNPQDKNEIEAKKIASYKAACFLGRLIYNSKKLNYFLNEINKVGFYDLLTIWDDMFNKDLHKYNIFFNYSDIQNLWKGINHYNEIENNFEIILKWIEGFEPLPQCSFNNHQCNNIACSKKDSLCNFHKCSEESCTSAHLDNHLMCKEHACKKYGCRLTKLPYPQNYCNNHACFVCLKESLIAKISNDIPPRNTCTKHLLCVFIEHKKTCLNLALPNSSYCECHKNKICSIKNCTMFALSHSDPHSYRHSYTPCPRNSCQKYKLSCKEPYCDYKNTLSCNDDNSKNKCDKLSSENNQLVKNESLCMITKNNASKVGIDDIKFTQNILTNKFEKSKNAITNMNKQSSLTLDKKSNQTSDKKDFFTDNNGCNKNTNAIKTFDQNAIDIEDLNDEPANYQHMREVYNFEEVEDGEIEEDIVQTNSNEFVNLDELKSMLLPENWSWEMSLEERWCQCKLLEKNFNLLLSQLNDIRNAEIETLRKKLYEEKNKANTRVYEKKSVIGGTIVGCITRLEAIRNTKPFAILIEEASEVLEPLVFSCLSETTCKLEMIGDHLQLKPSVKSNYMFKHRNKINFSMFERLICAPKSRLVPFSVLSTQRRMRKSICDLTRKFYKYITDIEDHDICNSKKIGGNFSGTSKECKTFDKLEICSGKSREVPGVLPNIFFWTHEGTQTKSKVGLSRINSTEAEMVIGLTKYLVNCGVPKSSIAILTPYKGQLMLMRLSLISLDLLNNKDRENSIVLSTVDRFQGDEADIVIISLVIDAKSDTGFVKKLNRMIVLLSRARLGMYIIGNINYFEEKPDASTCHWTDILTKLRQSCEPDTNPSAVLEKVEDLHYYGPRLGSELPICCPVHREKMVYYAKSVQQLNLNFCKEKCSELLSCEHSCDLLCHFKNKDDHNKRCSVIINPPLCETHAINLTCHELYKNVRISVPICYALKFYKCWEKVSVQLPCLHDCKIYCWEKIEIAEGKRFYPDCEQLAHSTYVYPICCHLLSVLCVVYHQYKKNPTLVKPCKSEVTYNPPCNHSVTVSCFLKQQFENGKLVFTCKKKLKKILPRCGHKASIYCDAFQTLNNWTGQSSELGVVYEGQSYGPADFICKEPVNFIYICKHVTKMACNLAFENASRSNKCHADVEIINPDCGHPTVIKCFQNQLLKNLPLKDPISEIKEGEITLQFNNHLQNHKCTFNILFHRRCGHNEKIQCFKVKNKHIQVCVVSVDINNPLCGHKLSLPCHLSDLNDWKPWKNETCSKFVNNVLFDDCPPPIFPSNELFNYVKRCKSKIIVRRKYCGHQYSIDCGVAFNELSNKTLRICSEVIKDALLNCGHKKTMSCSSYQIYKNDPESYSCTEQVSMSCWNIKNCKEKVLTECCKRSDRYSCKKKIDCTCSNGHTIKKIPICQDGFLMELWIPYAMLEKAQGKVLVIDEAYNLNDKWYGKEVLDVLVEKVQNTESDDIAVLLLGYEPQMREMLREKNPGLARRFAIDYPFVFEDYSESKLFVILKGVCKRENIQMSMEASEAILKLLEKQRAQANFGNAGAIDNVICVALAKVSSRPLTLEGMIELIPSDIGGRDAEKFKGSDPFARLNKLYLVENIRQQLIEIKNTFQVAQTESSIDRPELGHFVFQGAPGTGKTTVARVMAEILFDLGLLLRNHVEVTSGLGLTGEFVGHTKKRVKDKLDAARGGLLFIDEAYELGKGHYGEEAITTLVAAMTDPNYKLVIVIAGYPKDMEQMLSVNVGLKSRFKRFMNFEDWNTNDCINFLRIKAEADNYNFDVDVKNSLHEGLEELRSYPGWGNVRDMLALWQKMLEHRANRVVKMPELNKKIIKLDAMNALKAMVNDRRPKVANAGNINSVLKEASELQIVNQHDHGSQKKLFEVLDESIDDIDVSKRFTKIINPLSFTEKVDSDLEDIRNSGVPDEVWIELQLAKIALKEEKKNEEERQANEKKFQEDQENLLNELLRELQEEREEEKRQQMLQELEKKREEERKRREAEDIRLKEERQKSKDVENAIYKICLCPAGYSWYKQGGGWRCGGGSHFVTDEQLQR